MRNRTALLAVALLAGINLVSLPLASALQIEQRSVTLSNAAPSAVSTDSFTFTLQSTDYVGSLVFQFCANSPLFEDSCTAPSGLDASHASLVSETGSNVDFNVDSPDGNTSKVVLTQPVQAVHASPSTYNIGNITNPSAVNTTTYVRISSYASTNGSGSPIDKGAVAFSTVNNFNVGAYVPPYLIFCAAVTVAPDCSSTDGYGIDLGELSSTHANTATSQFAISTNDFTGGDVYVVGTTMTSGNNIIASVQNQPNRPGTAQFGINLRRNTNPAIGAEQTGDGTSVLQAGYNQPNIFNFNSGDMLTSSPVSTAYNRMTVSYLVNVPANQAPGVYVTTLTYLAAAQF